MNARRLTSVGSVVPGGHPIDPILWILLVGAFFLGPLKLLGVSWFSYLLPDCLAGVALFVIVWERIARRNPVFARSALTLPLVFLGAYCLLELSNPEAPLVRSLLGLRSWLLYLAFYFVGLYAFRTERQIERLYSVLLALGFVTAFYGIYQWKTGPQAFADWSEDYGRYARLAWSTKGGVVFRAFSTFVAPGTFAGNMALLMMLAFGVVASDAVPRRWRAAAAVAFVAMAAGIAVSGSRGPVVHLALAGVLMLALLSGFRSRIKATARMGMLVGIVILVVVIPVGSVFGERFATILDPESLFWKWYRPMTGGIAIAFTHPMGMGLGYTAGVPSFMHDQFFRDLPTANVDSGYGAAAAELGLLGLLLFAYLAIKVGVEGLRAWRKLPPGRTKDLFVGPMLLAVTYPVVSVIAQPQATLPSSIYFWLLIGMLVRASSRFGEGHADRVFRSDMHYRE